jgi:hypothetical protein
MMADLDKRQINVAVYTKAVDIIGKLVELSVK